MLSNIKANTALVVLALRRAGNVTSWLPCHEA